MVAQKIFEGVRNIFKIIKITFESVLYKSKWQVRAKMTDKFVTFFNLQSAIMVA